MSSIHDKERFSSRTTSERADRPGDIYNSHFFAGLWRLERELYIHLTNKSKQSQIACRQALKKCNESPFSNLQSV